MERNTEFFLGKQVIFEEIKVYVGLREELQRCTRYYLYACYGKKWKEGPKYNSIHFLMESLKQAKSSHLPLATDIKNNKKLYQEALNDLLILVVASKPLISDEYNLNLIISFHYDMERVIKTVRKSRKKS